MNEEDEFPQRGQRVRYMRMREAARNGWTGTVVRPTTRHSDFAVAWDQAEPWQNPTNYSLPAFGQYVHPLDNGHAEGGEGDTYLVAGENGGNPFRVQGYGRACHQAERRARRSRSGQRYIVFAPLEAYRRADPPVERETFGHGKSRGIRWDKIHPEYRYAAMDHNGKWFAYHHEPYPDDIMGKWVSVRGSFVELQAGSVPYVDPEHWSCTLTVREDQP